MPKELFKKYGHEAEYDTVESFIQSKPQLIGDCILLLNWANPNHSTFDYEAIGLLKPLFVLSIIETTGIAGIVNHIINLFTYEKEVNYFILGILNEDIHIQ